MASFDENGKYIKTDWKAGDKITATKLNKIEESIEAVNENDISRHIEADARLDALEDKNVLHDVEFTNVRNLIADNKAAAELGDYEINSRMQCLEQELNEGIEEVHNVADTVDRKIATAEANVNNVANTVDNKIAKAKVDMEAMIAEADADFRESYQIKTEGNLLPDSSELYLGSEEQPWCGIFLEKGIAMYSDSGSCGINAEGFLCYESTLRLQGGESGRKIYVDSDNLWLLPDGDGWNLGSDTNRWSSLHVKGVDIVDETLQVSQTTLSKGALIRRDGDLYIRGGSTETGIRVVSDRRSLEPDVNGTWDLGRDDVRWNNIYSIPFNMYVEDNTYTSRLKANRGNFRLVDGYDTSIFSWSHDYSQIGPDTTNVVNLGSANYRFKTLYLNAQPNVSSDRTLKENIKYINSDESDVSYEDMYAFVKDDLELATYNLVEHDKLNMGFIAQDLLVNLDGTDNKVGQMIVNPVAVPTEEEIENGTPYPTLSYDMGMYTSVLAGALKEAINKIEQLEARINELENK